MKSKLIVRVRAFTTAAVLCLILAQPSLAPGQWALPPQSPEESTLAAAAAPPERHAAKKAVEAQTLPATNIASDFACLNACLAPDDQPALIWFEYGTTPDCGFTTEKTAIAAGEAEFSMMEHMPGLTPGTTYYFRIVARNQAGTIYGGVQTFTTPVSDTLEETSDHQDAQGGCFAQTLTF